MNWNENKTKFYFIIIIALIIVILLQKCGGGSSVINHNDTITNTVITHDTFTQIVPEYIPKWKTKKEYVHDTTHIIDTAYVVGDYYSTYYYEDSIKGDSLKLYVKDSISENKIKSRSIKYQFILPTINTTNTVIKNKVEFYVGLGLVGGKSGINYFGPELLLRTKKKQAYGLGIGIDGNLQPNLSLRTYWKIGKK